jgi:hypothetical protein
MFSNILSLLGGGQNDQNNNSGAVSRNVEEHKTPVNFEETQNFQSFEEGDSERFLDFSQR